MARYIDVIVTVDGFQYGEEEFILQAMAMILLKISFQWSQTYQTAFLMDHPWDNLNTYKIQENLHGHSLNTPGAAQHRVLDHLCWALCQVQLTWVK